MKIKIKILLTIKKTKMKMIKEVIMNLIIVKKKMKEDKIVMDRMNLKELIMKILFKGKKIKKNWMN